MLDVHRGSHPLIVLIGLSFFSNHLILHLPLSSPHLLSFSEPTFIPVYRAAYGLLVALNSLINKGRLIMESSILVAHMLELLDRAFSSVQLWNCHRVENLPDPFFQTAVGADVNDFGRVLLY